MDIVGEPVSFTIPSLPSSMNQIYSIIRMPGIPLRVEMKPEVRRWKTESKVYIPMLKPQSDSYLFRLDAVFFYPFHHRNGKMKKFDTQNLLKVLIDAVAEKNGIGDEYFKSGSWGSIDSEKERIECILGGV